MSEIASDLCQSTSSLPSSASGDISRSNSAHSLTISLSTSNSNQHCKSNSSDTECDHKILYSFVFEILTLAINIS